MAHHNEDQKTNKTDHSYASKRSTGMQLWPEPGFQEQVIKQENVGNHTESCQKCAYYHEELKKKRGIEDVLQGKRVELNSVRKELRYLQTGQKERKDNRLKAALKEAISARGDQRKAEEEASRYSSQVQKLEREIQNEDRKTGAFIRELQEENKILREENASRNLELAHVHNLQEEIQVLRKENENLLTTLEDNFSAHAKSIVPNKYQKQQCSRSVSNPDMENGALHCQKPKLYNVEDHKSDEDDDSDAKMWESEEDDDENYGDDVIFIDTKEYTSMNGSLDVEDDVMEEEREEELNHKVCLWLAPNKEPCHKIVRTMQELKAHVGNEHTVENVKLVCMWQKCRHKRKAFNLRCSFIAHVNMHIGEANLPTFPCRFVGCEMVFLEQHELDIHLIVHFEKSPPPLRYTACDKKGDCRTDATEHVSNGYVPKFLCQFPECGKAFARRWSATRHEKTVHKAMKKCGMNSTSDNELKRHKQVGHTSCPDQASIVGKRVPSEKAHSHNRFQCLFLGCNRTYKTCSHLVRHNKIHASGKRFSCSTCNKMFTTKSQLEAHDVQYHDAKCVHCTYKGCMKSYRTQSDLESHEKSHGESVSRQLFNGRNKHSASKKPIGMEPPDTIGNFNVTENSNYANGDDLCGSPLNMQATPHEQISDHTKSCSSCSGERTKRKKYYL